MAPASLRKWKQIIPYFDARRSLCVLEEPVIWGLDHFYEASYLLQTGGYSAKSESIWHVIHNDLPTPDAANYDVVQYTRSVKTRRGLDAKPAVIQ